MRTVQMSIIHIEIFLPQLLDRLELLNRNLSDLQQEDSAEAWEILQNC